MDPFLLPQRTTGRCKIGHSFSTHSFLISLKILRPFVTNATLNLSVQHIILVCTKYRDIRNNQAILNSIISTNSWVCSSRFNKQQRCFSAEEVQSKFKFGKVNLPNYLHQFNLILLTSQHCLILLRDTTLLNQRVNLLCLREIKLLWKTWCRSKTGIGSRSKSYHWRTAWSQIPVSILHV